jgi:catechol 2,3-dioxygenase-like lactoylglutathione lyase family enzyme
MTLRPEDLYHTGIVVDDLDAAIKRMQAVAGYQFTDLMVYPMSVETTQGIIDVTFRFVYSIQVPYIELVDAIPGTVWTPAPGNAAHHLGFFVDDLLAEGAELGDAGFEREVGGLDGGQPGIFAYYRDPLGVRIELVDRAVFRQNFAFMVPDRVEGSR